MLSIILLPQSIDRFQALLASSLGEHGFSKDDTTQILEGATNAYKAIAVNNPIKPPTLPDSGVDVGQTLRNVAKNRERSMDAILKNPELLFKTHGISVPQDVTFTPMVRSKRQYKERKQKPPAPPRKPRKIAWERDNISFPPIDLIIDAATAEYALFKKRPGQANADIPDGPLKGMGWGSLGTRLRNQSDFIMREGFKTISQVFDVLMFEKHSKPCPSELARTAFCDAFERASKSITDPKYGYKTGHESELMPLPYVFRLLEESLIAMNVQKEGRQPQYGDIVDAGPLGKMDISMIDLRDMFDFVRNQNPRFPFCDVHDFSSKRRVFSRANEEMKNTL